MLYQQLSGPGGVSIDSSVYNRTINSTGENPQSYNLCNLNPGSEYRVTLSATTKDVSLDYKRKFISASFDVPFLQASRNG